MISDGISRQKKGGGGSLQTPQKYDINRMIKG